MSETPAFIICRASAGSGKTYTLVRQYIEIAISSGDPRFLETRFERILAITFTNAAANGMKERITKTLNDIVSGVETRLVADMADHLGIEGDEVVRRCGIVRTAILHHYSKFAVCTIDSFVLRIVKTFAHDFGLPLNFGVQVKSREMLVEAVDNLVALAGTSGEKPLTDLLARFVEKRLEAGKRDNIERTLSEIADSLLKEDAYPYLKELESLNLPQFLEIERSLEKANSDFRDSMVKAACKATDAATREKLTLKDFPYGNSGYFAFFQRIANGDISNLEVGKRLSYAMEQGVFVAKNTPAATVAAIERMVPDLLDSFGDLSALMAEPLVRYHTRILILDHLYELALLTKLREVLNDYYHENEIVHISEFNKQIAEKVVDEPAPFIYERIGNRYSNYLIDEFQDTSKLQWLNFLPLLDEALSRGSETGRASLVVGDGKQAIYRFRQGDVRQFVRLPEVDNPLHGRLLKPFAHFMPLNVNRRTLGKVVDFNNALFEWLIPTHYADNTVLNSIFIGEGEEPELRQKWSHGGGYVEVDFCQREAIWPQITEAVRHQVDDLGYSYSDILVLAHKGKILGQISNSLTAAGIPIVSAETFILGKSKAVKLLRMLLAYIHNPGDREAAANVLTLLSEIQPRPTVSVDELLWRLREARYNLSLVLDAIGIDFNTDRLSSMSLYDCCEELLRAFGLQGVDTASIATLLSQANTFAQVTSLAVGDFVEYLDENMDDLSSSTASDLDAVSLMTVHTAKGLEAPVVIYAIVNQGNKQNPMWVKLPDRERYGLPAALVNKHTRDVSDFSADFAEEVALQDMDSVNAFYVAMTRPKHKLLVYCERRGEGKRLLNPIVDYLAQFAALPESGLGLQTPGNETEAAEVLRFATGDDIHFPQNDDNARHAQKVELPNIVSPRWEGRISIADRSQPLLSSLASDSRRFGIAVHDLLSHIVVADDAVNVVNRFCISHQIAASDRDAMLGRIQAMLARPDVAPFFDGRYTVRCEMPMLIDGHERRPDRVMFAPDETWVVDFKTGDYDPKSHKDYEEQVSAYAAAIAALGYPNVKTSIIYL